MKMKREKRSCELHPLILEHHQRACEKNNAKEKRLPSFHNSDTHISVHADKKEDDKMEKLGAGDEYSIL